MMSRLALEINKQSASVGYVDRYMHIRVLRVIVVLASMGGARWESAGAQLKCPLRMKTNDELPC